MKFDFLTDTKPVSFRRRTITNVNWLGFEFEYLYAFLRVLFFFSFLFSPLIFRDLVGMPPDFKGNQTHNKVKDGKLARI